MTAINVAKATTSMQGELIRRNSAWPDYFDVDVLVFLEDWDIRDGVLRLNLSTQLGFTRVQITTVTPLPDDLVFLRGIYLPDENHNTVYETYYGIASRWQYAARQTSSSEER